MDENKRELKRNNNNGTAYFMQHDLMCKLKITDYSSKGVGACCDHEFKPGERGLLNARMPHRQERESYFCEVIWCMPDPSAADSEYPYRLGFRFID